MQLKHIRIMNDHIIYTRLNNNETHTAALTLNKNKTFIKAINTLMPL